MRAVFLVAIAQVLAGSALSQTTTNDLQVEVKLSGMVYLNPPQFIITADDQIVGRGEVGSAADRSRIAAVGKATTHFSATTPAAP